MWVRPWVSVDSYCVLCFIVDDPQSCGGGAGAAEDDVATEDDYDGRGIEVRCAPFVAQRAHR